ncbi:thioredoxin-disulfide reductase [Alphaproteobacteria bacterium endosymbiont of Tiliacea citrago]|uniref:thioredoxin-disulfide reductase n=1 Tax=Alphaproteobacteria bacterium endosymbiont of Tiliacea citrago TaxID=3077944 RepID=UPI00313BEA68
MFDILIIGSGPAGLTAGIYAKRANKKTGIVEGKEICGQLMKTAEVENYPGFATPIQGPKLMLEMYNQVKNLNTEFIKDFLIDFEKKEDEFIVKLSKQTLKTKTLIIATGATPIMLGIEKKFIGKGVSTCATCDGSFFKQKTVAIIGGGNTAAEEALYLSNIAKKIYLIHRGSKLTSEEIAKERLNKKTNIEKIFHTEVIEFLGDDFLSSIIIKNNQTNEKQTLKVDGTFIAIGYKPNTSFLANKLDLDAKGYVKDQVITKIKGLFVAGDVHDSKYRQAITAAGYGCMASLEALKYLDK